ncbi:Zona pellucida-like domain-containing 2 [Apodemus speciosus]|uniref:Zona pellucida-like domain-containing 2 n=1 Tax=Apodemus speciosus TaxID=105296 RepID=A0ABQ0EPR3_APOSI
MSTQTQKVLQDQSAALTWAAAGFCRFCYCSAGTEPSACLGSVLVWAVASNPPSSKGSELNQNLSCPSTSSFVPQRTNGHTSTEELNSSLVNKIATPESQGQTTSATLPPSSQSSSKTGPTEQTASTAHTAVKTVTDSMSLLDPMVTSTAKEPGGSSKTTILFTLATSVETTQPNQTPSSPTPDEVINTNKPVPTTTIATRDTSLPTTTILRTTVLTTATSETQERDTITVPTTHETSPTMSKPPDTHHSTVTQTPSQPAQTDSSVSMIELTTLPPPSPITTGMRSSESPSPGEADMTMTTPLMTITPSMTTTLLTTTTPSTMTTSSTMMTPSTTSPSMTSSTLEDAILSSGTGTPTKPEKLTLIPPSSTPDEVTGTNKPVPMTTTATRDTSSPTTAMLRTTVLSTATSETQERDNTTVPPTLATSPPTRSKSPDTHHSTVTQTPSQLAQTDSSVSPGTTQSSEPSTALAPSSSETTKSSSMIGTSKASPNSNQSSGPGDGTCALDEYQASTGGCACNDTYYPHLELSREIVTLRCGPQDIEVSLRSCFLKTQHWVLKQDTFEKCFSISTTEEGHRVQVFQLEKKEGACGLHISTNSSHVQHSSDVHLEQARPGSRHTDFRVLHFSCVYPLVVNVSKPVSYQEVSILSVNVPNTGETVVTLSIFTDSNLSAPLKNSTAPVGMPLYVVLKSANTDPERFSLVANEIFASSNVSSTEAKAAYHFVKESCPVQGRMLQDLNNGVSIYVTLAFTLSRFLNSDMLYLHAQVTLCDKQVGHPCQPSCSGKNPLRRNSPWDARAGDQMEPGGGKWIVFGPLRISESRASGSGNSAGAWIAIFFLIMIGWMLE